jgi:hypothetical protein
MQTTPEDTTMSTQIAEEFKRVKRALPLIHRAWLYVNDHPGVTAVTVGSALNEQASTVSSALGSAWNRGMMTRLDTRNPKGQTVYVYSVPSHMKEYELFPLATVKRPDARPNVTSIVPVPAPAPAPRTPDLRKIIETLTIAEARVLYGQLHKMFGAT